MFDQSALAGFLLPVFDSAFEVGKVTFFLVFSEVFGLHGGFTDHFLNDLDHAGAEIVVVFDPGDHGANEPFLVFPAL